MAAETRYVPRPHETEAPWRQRFTFGVERTDRKPRCRQMPWNSTESTLSLRIEE
jgi:hypothetical protein